MRDYRFWLAWAASAAALILAFLAKVVAPSVSYDPMVALTSLTAIAIVWYTYFTWQTLEQARKTAKDEADRLRTEREQRQEAIHTQISTIAFKLQRELRAMLEHPDISDAGTIGSWARTATLGHPVTEREILQLMSLVPEASNDRQTALQEAYVTYYASSEKINGLAKHPRPDTEVDMWTWGQWVDDAKANLRECVAVVEHVILPALREAERGVRSRRAAEAPFSAPDARQSDEGTEEQSQ